MKCSMRLVRRLAGVLLLAAGMWSGARAGDPVGYCLETHANRVVITAGGKPFAEYVTADPATNKTYLWPVYGPEGQAMTRAFPMKTVDGEVQDHVHHRGICFGHEDIGGFDSWAERLTFDKGEQTSPASKERLARLGSAQHRCFTELSVWPDRAVVASELDYLAADGRRVATEIRRMVFHTADGQRLIDFDQDFIATDGEVTFGDKKDAGLSIRVPTSMSVDTKQGGRIVNSEGQTDAAAWGRQARWCDYYGPVEGATRGVAMLNHPSSFRHPTTWHVRTYGLFTANPFGTLDKDHPNGPHTLAAGARLRLRHRFVLHTGDAAAAKIEEAWAKYAAE